nr:hypothetical protein [uncultured bacterium]
MPTFSFVKAPANLTVHLQRYYNAPLPNFRCHSFGGILMPDYYPCLTARLVSCYALFK